MSQDEITKFEEGWKEILEDGLTPIFESSRNQENIFLEKNKFLKLNA